MDSYYYYLDRNNQQQGPVEAHELPKHGVTQNAKVWKEGMSDWQTAGSIPELSNIFSPPLPPPPPASYQTPPPPPQSVEQPAMEEKIKLYSLWSILGVTSLCGPLAAGILIRRNSLNLGREKEGLIIALIAGIVYVVLLVCIFFMDVMDDIPNFLFVVIYTGITYFIVKKLQGEDLKNHKEENNDFYSNWKALGIGLICLVVTILLFLGVFFAYDALYSDDLKDTNYNTESSSYHSSKQIENNKQQKQEENSFNNEQTEYYKYYYYGEFASMDMDWQALNVKITFEKKTVKVVSSEKTNTFIIVGSPESEYDEYKDVYYTKYNVYYSDDADKNIINIDRYKNETTITYESESCNYETFKKQE